MLDLNEQLNSISKSLPYLVAEYILISGIIGVLILGLIKKSNRISSALTLIVFISSLIVNLVEISWSVSVPLFHGMVLVDSFSTFFKILFAAAGILTVLMSWQGQHDKPSRSEYYALLLSIVLGANLLAMSTNFIMVFISLELISISSYVLAGFDFTKKSAEGSLKYFLFGSVASAIMIYGFSILYGFTGTLEFSTGNSFIIRLGENHSPLILIAVVLSLAGFLFKIVAVPMHPWAPDVYESAPMPVIAFFSVVPKLAGIAVLTKFSIDLSRQSSYDWQLIITIIAFLTLAVGNFSALMQKNAKRMMAYSSIAQSGFLLIGIASFLPQGIEFMIFYATVYLLMNYLVFLYLQAFENLGVNSISGFSGSGKHLPWPSVFCLVGLIALTGLPPTSGFTGKLFIFSSLWESYQLTHKPVLLALLIFGLLNTVVSLFFYLKIPFYAFLKSGEPLKKQNNLTFLNLLGLILVLLILALFFQPGLLMGWINKITFVE